MRAFSSLYLGAERKTDHKDTDGQTNSVRRISLKPVRPTVCLESNCLAKCKGSFFLVGLSSFYCLTSCQRQTDAEEDGRIGEEMQRYAYE